MELGRNLESDGIFPVSIGFWEGGACTTCACYARVNVDSSCVLLIRDQPESDTWKGPVSDDTWPNPLLPRGTNVFHHNRRPFPAIGAVSGDRSGFRRRLPATDRFPMPIPAPTIFPVPTNFRRLFRRPTIFSGDFFRQPMAVFRRPIAVFRPKKKE